MAFSLFGFTLSKEDSGDVDFEKQTVVDLESDGSTDVIVTSGAGQLVQYMDDFIPTEEIDRIISYREISRGTEVDKAINEIVGDSITDTEDVNVNPVTVNLDEVKCISEGIKKKIGDEFNEILYLLKYNNFFPKYFKQWYVDGRIYYHIVVDNAKPKEGIKQLINLEATRIKKYREITKNPQSGVDQANVFKINDIQEYFIYFPKEHWTIGKISSVADISNVKNIIRFNKNTIAYAPSGVIDEYGETISHLHKAIRPANQLISIEDSMVVYRMTRAPDRRAFYIDVGDLPKQKAEQYLQSVMNKYRNKISYDSKTGKMNNGKETLAMLEDYWLPRTGTGKGTEIVPLSGGDSNIMDSESALYFRKKLYESLNVPTTRLESDSIFNMSKGGEITRDEIKFSKFIIQLRNTFAFYLFNDLLKTQLVLKNIIKESEWAEIEKYLKYDFSEDSHFAELKNLDIMKTRLEILDLIAPFTQTYFSRDYVKKSVLQQSDEEIEQYTEERLEDQKDKSVPQPEEEDAQGGPPNDK